MTGHPERSEGPMYSLTKLNHLIRALIWLAAAVVFGASASAQVVRIVVDDTIQPVSAEYISRAIDQAHRTNAQALLIEMNTPGGLVSSTRDIIEKITGSTVPVIVYINPTGGHAGSAGTFLL